MAEPKQLPPFLRVPLEIRLDIYRLLLIGDPAHVETQVNLAALPEYYEYEKHSDLPSTERTRVLSFRNTNPQHFRLAAHKSANKLRTAYKVRSGRFRAECMDVTYNCVNVPDIDTTILRVSKQCHEEAARLLYTSYIFDFDTSIEACIPFLGDLTSYSRSFVRRLSLVKKAIPYDKDFDRCEWANMCQYIATNLNLVSLDLGVVSGKPITSAGAELVVPIPEEAWGGLVNQHKRDEMQWARDLMCIKGLVRLDIRPCVEHCPPPQSNALMFFVAFSASVAGGFGEWLHEQMIETPKGPAPGIVI